MKTIQDADVSGIKIQNLAVYRHQWAAGETFISEPPKMPNIALFYQLWLVKQGCVECHANGKMWQVKSGEACLLPASLERKVITPEPAVWLSLSLRISVFNKFNLLEGVSFPAHWEPDEIELQKMESWIEEMSGESLLDPAQRRLIIDGLSHALFGLCWARLSSAPLALSVQSALPAWLAQTMRRISEDPTCTIADLAHEAGFSPAQFRRVFHQRIGDSPRDYLTSRRLEAACNYLEQTDLPLRAIAERVGLRNVSHLSLAFKNVYGLSPSQYRSAKNITLVK